MLKSFTIGDHRFDVYLDETAASQANDGTSFVMSLEDLYCGLHCDNIFVCDQNCPVFTECNLSTGDLPYTLVSANCPELLNEYPEYLI
jgi:hypothetical protein